MPLIAFKELIRDQPPLGAPGEIDVENVIAVEGGYAPVKKLSVLSNALDGPARGGIGLVDSSGNALVYSGDSTKLYREENDYQFANVSKAGNYTLATDDYWDFINWTIGNQIIANAYSVVPQVVAVGITGLFADLITDETTLKFNTLTALRGWLVGGWTTDTTFGEKRSRVRWSHYRDATKFAVSAANQSSFSDMDEGGTVRRIVGGAEYGVIFQDSIIRRMEFVGGADIFGFPPVDRKRGTSVARSIAALGRLIFYLSGEGVFVFDGTQSIPIGANKIDRRIDKIFDFGKRQLVRAAVDAANKTYMLAIPTNEASTQADRLFIYNWERRRWTEADIPIQTFVDIATPGITEDLSPFPGPVDESTLTDISFDDPAFAGGDQVLAVFDSANKLASFAGENMKATIITGDNQFFPGSRTLLTGARPLVEANEGSPDEANYSLSIAGRDNLSDTPVYGTPQTPESDGVVSLLSNARYQRFKLEIAENADWSIAQGIEIPEERMSDQGSI